MSTSDDCRTASERAIDSYLNELLEEPGTPGDAALAAVSEPYRLFDVSGLAVALPAADVREDMACPALQAGPGMPPWLRRTAAGARARWIVDIALLVLPDDLSPDRTALESRCDRVLMLQDGDWGIALAGSTWELQISPDRVCWRGPLGRRPWLAGTIADSRCVLLDLGNIRRLGQFGVE